jgi:hypothetical protein
MTTGSSTAATQVLREFEGPWRDDTPVFGCCRKAIQAGVDGVDLVEVASHEVTARVQALRAAVEAETPGHLAAHRCCAGHLADLAFDLPQLLAPAEDE